MIKTEWAIEDVKKVDILGIADADTDTDTNRRKTQTQVQKESYAVTKIVIAKSNILKLSIFLFII